MTYTTYMLQATCYMLHATCYKDVTITLENEIITGKQWVKLLGVKVDNKHRAYINYLQKG